MPIRKTCSGCNETFPLTEEYFHRDHNYKHKANKYFATLCKTCHYKAHIKWTNTKRGRLSRALKRAKSKEKSTELTLDFLMELYNKQNGLCALSGIIMESNGGNIHKKNKINPHIISIDRIDNNKGYTKDNVQLVCGIVNRMRNELSIEQFILYCERIIQYANKKDEEGLVLGISRSV